MDDDERQAVTGLFRLKRRIREKGIRSHVAECISYERILHTFYCPGIVAAGKSNKVVHSKLANQNIAILKSNSCVLRIRLLNSAGKETEKEMPRWLLLSPLFFFGHALPSSEPWRSANTFSYQQRRASLGKIHCLFHRACRGNEEKAASGAQAPVEYCTSRIITGQ